MRNLIFKAHLVVALAAGLFIVMLGVTGSVMAFETEIEHLLHWRLNHVKPNGQAKSLAEIADVAQRAYPQEKLLVYLLPQSPDIAIAVALKDHLVHVNQYTGEVLGAESPGMDLLGYVHQLHLRLALMDKGREAGGLIMTWSGVASLFLVITGAYLWWPTKRLTIRCNGSSRRFWFDVHNALGIVSLVFVLLLSATGVIIGFEQKTTPMLYKMTGSPPVARPKLQSTPIEGAQMIGPDEALAIAAHAAPGVIAVALNPPQGPRGEYLISAHYPEDRTPGGRTRIAVDPWTGQVPYKLDSRTAPAGYRAVNLNRAIHTGDIFGYPSKFVMSLASLVMPLQLATGLLMWLKRRKAEKRAIKTVPQAATVLG